MIPPITPDDVRQHLAGRTVAAGFAAPRTAPAGSVERAAILASISASYFRLRGGLAVIALAFPPVLWLGAGGHALAGSISAYYHVPGAVFGGGIMRDVFVGALWAIGAFLFFYKGYSAAENRALNLAGAAAVAIAISPMDWPEGSAATLTGRVHGAAAIVFFLAVAYVCLARAGDTLTLLPVPRRRAFARTYSFLGTLMVVLPVGVAGLHVLLGRAAFNVWVFAIEVAAIYVFAVFWLVKSREIALIEATPAA